MGGAVQEVVAAALRPLLYSVSLRELCHPSHVHLKYYIMGTTIIAVDKLITIKFCMQSGKDYLDEILTEMHHLNSKEKVILI